MDDRRLFIDEQMSLDLAVGCLVDGHTWEALRDAIDRVQASLLVPVKFSPVHVGGLGLV